MCVFGLVVPLLALFGKERTEPVLKTSKGIVYQLSEVVQKLASRQSCDVYKHAMTGSSRIPINMKICRQVLESI